MPRTIVIVGAGFGGLGVARWLELRAEAADVHVILVDRQPAHQYQPLLYEVATGHAPGRSEDAERALAAGTRVDLHAYERRFRGTRVTFRNDEVTAIDRHTRRLQFRGGAELAYDGLVLALGSEVEYYGIPGLREHAIPLKVTADALRIRRRILDGVARVHDDPDARWSIIIGGGGATGVEFACELGNALHALVARRVIRRDAYAIALVEAGTRLITAFPDRFARAALQRLHRFGVHVFLDTCVQRVDLGRVVIAPRPLRAGEQRDALLCGFDGPEHVLASDCLIWTGGIRFPVLPREAGFACDAKGRIVVGEDFAVRDETRVFALGDCAAETPRGAQLPLPPLASIAIREAPTVAANVLASLDDRALRRFRSRILPSILPLGGKRAGLAYRGWTWIGRMPWILHQLVALRYFCATFGVWGGARIWWRGARCYIQND
jgi:NADH dehydrogenase